MLTLIDTGYRHSFIVNDTLHCLTSSLGIKPWFLIPWWVEFCVRTRLCGAARLYADSSVLLYRLVCVQAGRAVRAGLSAELDTPRIHLLTHRLAVARN